MFSGAFGRSDTHGVGRGRNINGHYLSDICLLANKSKLWARKKLSSRINQPKDWWVKSREKRKNEKRSTGEKTLRLNEFRDTEIFQNIHNAGVSQSLFPILMHAVPSLNNRL